MALVARDPPCLQVRHDRRHLCQRLIQPALRQSHTGQASPTIPAPTHDRAHL